MEKIVRYNGGTGSYYRCASPSGLVKGQEYEVLAIEDRGYQTDYYLKGIIGNFNSVWFDVVSTVNVFMAFAETTPTVGEVLKCNTIEVENNKIVHFKTVTSRVKKVEDIGNNIYKVQTRNSTYIVKVG